MHFNSYIILLFVRIFFTIANTIRPEDCPPITDQMLISQNDSDRNDLIVSHFQNFTDRLVYLNVSWDNMIYPCLNLTITPIRPIPAQICDANSLSQLISVENAKNLIVAPIRTSAKRWRITYGCLYNVQLINYNEIEKLVVNKTHLVNDTIIDDFSIRVFNKDGYTRFNLTWNESVFKEDTFVDFKFFILDNGKFITLVDFTTEHLLIKTGNLIMPNIMNPETSLDTTRTYKIEIIKREFPEGHQISYYTVPACVEDKCNCDMYKFKLLNIKPLTNHRYNITWQSISESSLPILDIDFYFSSNESQYYHTNVTYKMVLNNSTIVYLKGLHPTETYEVSARFNSEHCKAISTENTLSLIGKNEESSEASSTTHIVLTTIIVILIVLCVTITFCKKPISAKLKTFLPGYARKTSTINLQQLNMTPNAIYVPTEANSVTHDKYEFPRKNIVVKKEIDGGAFGKIYYAKAFGISGTSGYTMVAIKQLRECAPPEEVTDFQAEIDLLKKIGEHPHIVRLLGCCTLKEPLMMIMELVACGSLKNYLLALRKEWEEKKKPKVFFPDDMDMDLWTNGNAQSKPLNYPRLTRPDYITPPVSPTPLSSLQRVRMVPPKIPDGDWTSFSTGPEFKLQKPPKSVSPNNFTPSSNSPGTSENTPLIPPSTGSSRLPSTTETMSTTLDFEAQTPAIEEFTKTLTPTLSNNELQDFATQIVDGMMYLESIPIVHRDLAARNILITTDKKLKISDFGMSKVGPYLINSNKPMPLRWMAMETLESRHCDNKSDVWSFGVVLWEIGTLGAQPYKDLPNELIYQSLKRGVRLSRPEVCTDELYSLMQRCWMENPDDRPTFSEISEILDENKRKMYVDFSRINPDYVFPSTSPVKANKPP